MPFPLFLCILLCFSSQAGRMQLQVANTCHNKHVCFSPSP